MYGVLVAAMLNNSTLTLKFNFPAEKCINILGGNSSSVMLASRQCGTIIISLK